MMTVLKLRSIVFTTVAVLVVGGPALAVELPVTEEQRIIGVSPSAFIVPNLLQSSSQERSFTVSHNFPAQGINQDVPIRLNVRGDYPEYLKIPAETVAVAGTHEFEVDFTIDAAQAAEGEYEFFIDVMPDLTANNGAAVAADDESGALPGAAVVLGVTVPVQFTVTSTEEAKIEIFDVVAAESELDLPIFFTAGIQNSGNVDWRPDEVAIVFTPTTGGGVEQSITIPGESFPLIRAGQDQNVTFRAEPILSEGTYAATIQFIDDGEVRSENSDIVVVVNPKGVLNQEATVGPVTLNKTTVAPNELVRALASVENVGDIVVQAQLEAILFSGQTEVAQYHGDPLVIDPKSVGNPELIFRIDSPGVYELRSWVEYGNKKSDMTQTTITVVKPAVSVPARDSLLILLAGLAAALIFGAVGLMAWMRRKGRLAPKNPAETAAPEQQVESAADEDGEMPVRPSADTDKKDSPPNSTHD